LKNGLHEKMMKVENNDDGVDYFFKSKVHANKMVDFLCQIIPCRKKESVEFISHDEHTSVTQNKHVWSIEIPKICKEDLVIINKSFRK